MSNSYKPILRAAIKSVYAVQKTRIQNGNRLATNFKIKLGIKPGEKEEDQKAADKILKQIRNDYKRLTDGIVKFPSKKKFVANGIISDYAELLLIQQYEQMVTVEEDLFKAVKTIVQGVPFYMDKLRYVKGIGPAMAGILLSEIDITKAKYPSSLWMYAGLDVVTDKNDATIGKARSMRKEHLIDVEYVNKKGEVATKKSITFNRFLHDKILGVMGGSFLKTKSPYADVYYNYRNRLDSNPKHDEKSLLHKHNMSTRYMAKIFMIDLHMMWREYEGLPVSVPYHEAKLGLKHGMDKAA